MSGSTVEITLRRFELSDVDDFLVRAGDNRVTRYCRWDTYTSREEAATFIEEMISSHPWYRAICADGRPVGSIFVMPAGTGKDGRRGEIGYALCADWWGRGVATAAVKMALEAAGKELKFLDRIEGLVFKENVASQRVLEKAGFVKEGLLKKYFHVKGRSKDIVVFGVIMNHN